ncbi:MAG: LLM class flavin-dependent oxidoreductase [Dehalococcoidia bacterium]|nr:LLM class flavin-dependent oxidoreductase [Dehalococcoidia bacterium]|tara:strand:+ start:7 stop:1170 length:1164 start_codon:yes stop_codon:yes gene_type:complete
MTLPERMKFGIFMAPFHWLGDNPTLALERDLETIQWLDHLGYDEAWIGEHHSAGWETISSPEVFMGVASERTKHIKLGTGVASLPYHHPLMLANRMVLLDHLTRGRVMLGVGPGALVSDAYALGIDPPLQRPRMDESITIIKRLLTEDEPITHKSDWFTLNEAMLHLRPYSQPYFPIAVAAAQSPSGMVAAGKHGLGVLSVSVPRGESVSSDLGAFWKIAEDTAEQYGQTVSRSEWRVVLHVHLAESKKDAFDQVREKSAAYQYDYFHQTMGQPFDYDGPREKIVDHMVKNGTWCVGTPDDLIEKINELSEQSGGFGGFMIQATEWGTREQVMHSYELIARYVMPHFQGSLSSLQKSQKWSFEHRNHLQELKTVSLTKATESYNSNR